MLSQKKPTKPITPQRKPEPQRGPLQAQAKGLQPRLPVLPPKAKPAPAALRPPQWPKPIQAKMARVAGITPKAVGVGARAVQFSRKAVREAVPIGVEGTITVKKKKYKGFLFVNANPVHFDFSHSDMPWPITLDFKGEKYFEFESNGGKKKTLVRWEDEGINAQYVFLNRNANLFFRLIVTVE
jgi:hypothetical protein